MAILRRGGVPAHGTSYKTSLLYPLIYAKHCLKNSR